jgi:hypothetical protein
VNPFILNESGLAALLLPFEIERRVGAIVSSDHLEMNAFFVGENP